MSSARVALLLLDESLSQKAMRQDARVIWDKRDVEDVLEEDAPASFWFASIEASRVAKLEGIEVTEGDELEGRGGKLQNPVFSPA